MLDACKHAAPVTAIESLVDDSADFNINPVPTQNFVIYQSQQFQKSTLISHIRICMGRLKLRKSALFSPAIVFVISPLLGLVLKHLLPMLFMVHVAPPARVDLEYPKSRGIYLSSRPETRNCRFYLKTCKTALR